MLIINIQIKSYLCSLVIGIRMVFLIHYGDQGILLKSRESNIYVIRNDVLVFSGTSNHEISREVCQRLALPLGNAKISRFVDGECNIQIYESIRGKEVYIIQSTCPPVNENIVELLLLISTMKRTSAKKITVIIPYYGYGRAVIIK